ncbi:MAG: hypothetical protein K6E54_03070 [Bacteroidaceae bacterium]|nr:hypothetical protein [Bacteroidaceae bacterium]
MAQQQNIAIADEEVWDTTVVEDSVLMNEIVEQASDSAVVDSIMRDVSLMQTEFSTEGVSNVETERWLPNPKKAMWLAIAIPGGGQIYNRKYWKLPIIYGGFLGCFYALTWNNTMYRDYSQAYIDIMDSDDNTQSYMNFIPSSYNVESNLSRLQDLFKRKKNFYRRYRDMSLFCMIGVYLISIIDAYVDAEMSSFDISPDLTLKLSPTIINDNLRTMRTTSLNGSSYGLNCSLNF